jgi:hypothetical protein
MGHFTYRKITSDAVVALRLVEYLDVLTGKGHRWVMFDIEEVSRVQVLIACRHFRIQACSANGDCHMRVRRLAFVNGERASDIGETPLHCHIRYKHHAHARGELDARCLCINFPGRDVRCRNLVTVTCCGHTIGFPLLC